MDYKVIKSFFFGNELKRTGDILKNVCPELANKLKANGLAEAMKPEIDDTHTGTTALNSTSEAALKTEAPKQKAREKKVQNETNKDDTAGTEKLPKN